MPLQVLCLSPLRHALLSKQGSTPLLSDPGAGRTQGRKGLGYRQEVLPATSGAWHKSPYTLGPQFLHLIQMFVFVK